MHHIIWVLLTYENDFLRNAAKTKVLAVGTRQQISILDLSNGMVVS